MTEHQVQVAVTQTGHSILLQQFIFIIVQECLPLWIPCQEPDEFGPYSNTLAL
jgi:uncharacterized protein YwgA